MASSYWAVGSVAAGANSELLEDIEAALARALQPCILDGDFNMSADKLASTGWLWRAHAVVLA